MGLTEEIKTCYRGHVLNEENSYIALKTGYVQCRLCTSIRNDNRKLDILNGNWNTNKTHCRHGHEFTMENTGNDSRGHRYCRTCRSEYWSKAGRDIHRKNRYNLTKEKHQSLYDEQHGLCAICFAPLTEEHHIDHDHNTGEVRGLLCSNHNLLLGYAQDSIEILSNAIKYLEKYRKDGSPCTH